MMLSPQESPMDRLGRISEKAANMETTPFMFREYENPMKG